MNEQMKQAARLRKMMADALSNGTITIDDLDLISDDGNEIVTNTAWMLMSAIRHEVDPALSSPMGEGVNLEEQRKAMNEMNNFVFSVSAMPVASAYVVGYLNTHGYRAGSVCVHQDSQTGSFYVQIVQL